MYMICVYTWIFKWHLFRLIVSFGRIYMYIYKTSVCVYIYICFKNMCVRVCVCVLSSTFMLTWPKHPPLCSDGRVCRLFSQVFTLLSQEHTFRNFAWKRTNGKMPRVVQLRLFGEKNTPNACFPQFRIYVLCRGCTMIYKWYAHEIHTCISLSLSLSLRVCVFSLNSFNMNCQPIQRSQLSQLRTILKIVLLHSHFLSSPLGPPEHNSKQELLYLRLYGSTASSLPWLAVPENNGRWLQLIER
jgi:hypothetical protein